jgi:uncharacterized protein DUF5667
MKRVKVNPEERFARMLEVESTSAALAGSDAKILPMMTLATALRANGRIAGPAPLSAASRDAMRQRLVAVASVQYEMTAADRLRRRHAESTARRMHKRVVTMAGSFAAVTAFAGVGVAAAHSLPGDPFYGVKRATEAVQLWATNGQTAKGQLHLEFAQTRLAEAEKLPANSPHLASTLAAMNSDTRVGSSELVAAYDASHSTKPLADLVTFTQHQYAGLVDLSKSVPLALVSHEVASLHVLTTITTTLRTVSGQTCLTCLVTGPTGNHPTSPSGPTTPPTSHPKPTPHPANSAPSSTRPSGHPSTPPASPSKTPRNLLPTNLIPSKLLPSLPALGGHHKHQLLSTPIPLISSLLKGLNL